MTNQRLERFAAGAGILGTLMSVTYVLMPPHGSRYPYTPQVIAEMARNHESYLFKNLLGTLSFFTFLFFLGSLYSALRRAEGDTGWLSLLALGGGLVMTAVHSLESVASYALAWHVAHEGDVAAVTALGDIQDLTAYYYAVPLAVMFVAASIVAYRTRVLPRWIAWLGFVAGAVWIVGAAGVLDPQNGPLTAIGFGIGLLVYWLWIPATSIVLMRRQDVAEQVSTVAATGTVSAGLR
jgi:hypothetical protein